MASAKRDVESADPREQGLLKLAGAALSGDDASARRLVSQLMRHRSGQELSAATVRSLGDLAADYDREGPVKLETRRPRVSSRVPFDAQRNGLLTVSEPAAVDPRHMIDPVLPAEIQTSVERIIAEHARADELKAHGLAPTTRLLLTGAPGVGKTLTANYLARRLRLPLAAIEPATVMSSLLGESARNLRQALDWSRANRCVLLIDEFDAFAKRRDDATDVGELKRLVNMLLLELDRWSSEHLLVAATNHPQLLDPAVERRFDVSLELPHPDVQLRQNLIAQALRGHNVTASSKLARLVAVVTEGTTGADLYLLVEGAVRRSVLEDVPIERSLVEGIKPPMSKSRADTKVRAMFCYLSHDEAGMSNRDIAELLGISNASVSGLVRSGRQAHTVSNADD